MNISVLGLGCVGCVTAACLARNGHDVIGVDVNPDKVAMINKSQSPIVEPGLGELIEQVVADGRLRATTDTAEAVASAHAVLICVGTPSLPHGRPDVDAIDLVAREIGAALSITPRDQPLAVILRSPVLSGTTEHVLIPALEAGLEGELRGRVRVAVNPEFMREGSSLRDFDEPPMILVGTDDPAAAALIRTMYLGVKAPFVHTSVRTAELAKFAVNAYHGLKVCFANEIADIASALGADGTEVMKIFAVGARRQRAAREQTPWVQAVS